MGDQGLLSSPGKSPFCSLPLGVMGQRGGTDGQSLEGGCSLVLGVGIGQTSPKPAAEASMAGVALIHGHRGPWRGCSGLQCRGGEDQGKAGSKAPPLPQLQPHTCHGGGWGGLGARRPARHTQQGWELALRRAGGAEEISPRAPQPPWPQVPIPGGLASPLHAWAATLVWGAGSL